MPQKGAPRKTENFLAPHQSAITNPTLALLVTHN